MMKKTQSNQRPISFNTLKERILELLFRAETFLKWTQTIYGYYRKGVDDSQNKFITTHVNLYFAESLGCIHTLLFGYKSDGREEISLNYLYENYSNKLKTPSELVEYQETFDKIKETYKKARLDVIRNKIFAHKDLVNSGDPITGFLNRINKGHINNLQSILNKTKDHLYMILPDHTSNNYFESLHEPVIKFIEEELIKVNGLGNG